MPVEVFTPPLPEKEKKVDEKIQQSDKKRGKEKKKNAMKKKQDEELTQYKQNLQHPPPYTDNHGLGLPVDAYHHPPHQPVVDKGEGMSSAHLFF
jgi:hypothetical protein